MTQLEKLSIQLDSPDVPEQVLEYCLDYAKDIICDIRDTDYVEPKYLNLQVAIAVEKFNKRGAEGQIGHSENGINRSYSTSDISPDLLGRITPIVKTPGSVIRSV